jgi:hypothetical protein
MIRPPLEVADIVRTYGTAFAKQHRHWLTALHLKVLRAIAACRTVALVAGQLTPLQSPADFAALLCDAAHRNCVVYAKRPFAGPVQVLTYLSRYYPPHCHRQLSACGNRQRSDHLPLARLRP